jgi:hypothetical protein
VNGPQHYEEAETALAQAEYIVQGAGEEGLTEEEMDAGLDARSGVNHRLTPPAPGRRGGIRAAWVLSQQPPRGEDT